MSASHPWVSLLTALLFGASLPSPAQTPPPAEPASLAALRASFLAQVITGSRQLNEQFNNALLKLEDELAASGDYEDAIQVQARRREVEATLAMTPSSALNPGVPMPASAAKTSSTVTIESDALTGWRSGGSYAEWTLQKLTPGRYTVQLSYVLSDAAPLPNGEPSFSSRFSAVEVAKFKFFEVSLLGPASANVRMFELARTPDAVTYAAATAEPILISRSSITLRLEALQGYAANTIRIKDIRLVPVEEKPAAPLVTSGSAAGTGEKDVETLKQLFSKQFAAACAPVTSEYLARLKTLAAQPSVASDQELLGEIEIEQKRAAGSALALLGTGDRKRGGPPGAGGLDGFEDISGARLVADPANSAERLKIEHEGRQFWIKLAWVRCPPSSEDDQEALHTAAKHFNIDESDALAIGRVAREFTLGYLEERPLRLLLRGKKNPNDEAVPALVFLEDLGLFQTMLVDRGFATVSLPSGSDRKPMLETALMKMLTEHEQLAMKRSPAPGAWAFRSEGSK